MLMKFVFKKMEDGQGKTSVQQEKRGKEKRKEGRKEGRKASDLF